MRGRISQRSLFLFTCAIVGSLLLWITGLHIVRWSSGTPFASPRQQRDGTELQRSEDEHAVEPLKAYVISRLAAHDMRAADSNGGSSKRFNNTVQLLRECGFTPHHLEPLSLDSDIIKLDSALYHETQPNPIRSNKYTHRLAIMKVAMDDSLQQSGWGFVFEDDIALHPRMDPSRAGRVIREATKLAGKAGFVYLGLCDPECAWREKFMVDSVPVVHCVGRCLHAYGVAKWRALWLYDEVVARLAASGQQRGKVEDSYAQPFLDELFYNGMQYWKTLEWPLLVGHGLVAPHHADHMGIFYQDRERYESQLHSPGS